MDIVRGKDMRGRRRRQKLAERRRRNCNPLFVDERERKRYRDGMEGKWLEMGWGGGLEWTVGTYHQVDIHQSFSTHTRANTNATSPTRLRSGFPI